ncbi:MAG: zeta toxin family protein, partial [Clostridiales bacterium]|nr:zeta toxin family protein [Clostridiales bacterium]
MNEKIKDYTDSFIAEDIKTAIRDNFRRLTKGKDTAVQPRVVIFMGGLPGAGKSNAIEDIKGEYKKNIISVDIDEY